MKILKFEDFLNENSNLLNESLMKGDSYLVGDSSSLLLGMTKELRNRVLPLEGLSEVGIGTYKFSELLKDYNEEHPETKFVFLFMGANDLYHINSNVIKSSLIVREEMDRIFPNAQKFIARAGSWGWGGLSVYGKQSSAPAQMFKYYDEIWKPLGYMILNEYIEIQYDNNGNPIHPTLEAPKIKELAREILDISEGRKEFYSEEIRSLRDISSIELEEEERLINYYDILQDSVHEGIELSRDSQLIFNPVVERAQVGLKFLGYELSKFGVDGLFGPETEESVKKYKYDNSVEGDPGTMDDYFFISLINNLKNKGFSGAEIENILLQGYDSIGTLSQDTGLTSPVYGGEDLGSDEYLIFVQHNQGVAGSASLVNSKFGKGEIHPFTRSKGMINNIPSDMPEYKKQIIEALNSKNDQRAASLFLEMWKIKYAAKKEEGMKLINTPKYSHIKIILEQAAKETGVPFEVLVAIATIESGLNPEAGNSNYKGLFALNPSTAVQFNPGLNYTNVYDPLVNAQAASKMLASGKNELAKNLTRSGVISNLDFA